MSKPFQEDATEDTRMSALADHRLAANNDAALGEAGSSRVWVARSQPAFRMAGVMNLEQRERLYERGPIWSLPGYRPAAIFRLPLKR
jgi:hypothetical protein